MTKQLMNDGTSRTVVYKPVIENETTKFVTMEQVQEELKKIDLTEIQKEIEELKKKINKPSKKGDE